METIFGFKELEQTTCISCGRVFRPAHADNLSIFYGLFTDAMRASRTPVDLIATLRARLNPENVQRDICAENACLGHSRAASSRRLIVSEGPQILVIGLQRKHFVGRALERINTPVRIPDRLNLEDIPDNEGFVGHYRLVGVVHHSGSASGGHYISHFLNLVGEKRNVEDPLTGAMREITDRKWFEANDAIITQLDGRPDETSTTATMIVYEKIRH